MGRILRTDEATGDLLDIWISIKTVRNEARATAFLRTIERKLRLLANQPLIGRARPELREGVSPRATEDRGAVGEGIGGAPKRRKREQHGSAVGTGAPAAGRAGGNPTDRGERPPHAVAPGVSEAGLKSARCARTCECECECE